MFFNRNKVSISLQQPLNFSFRHTYWLLPVCRITLCIRIRIRILTDYGEYPVDICSSLLREFEQL